ncbi:hypothetical protein EJ110_NYTH26582 [Nymphaea thermarum]|nr:hypothetical protein EJ110_NYTH26582 [Nymphaea thermarum]
MAATNEAGRTGTEGLPGGLAESQESGSYDDFESTCSTPYVSAPSSPGRPSVANNGYFFSAPTSPVHYFGTPFLEDPTLEPDHFPARISGMIPSPSTDFEFASRLPAAGTNSVSSPPATMISADELFLNGQIRPMRLPTHIQKPSPSPGNGPTLGKSSSVETPDDDATVRGRDLRSKNRSLRRRTRSLSPLRNTELGWPDFPRVAVEEEEEEERKPADPAPTAASARRSSKRWISLKDFLYRSKSEGRGYVKEKLSWSALSFSPSKERKASAATSTTGPADKPGGGTEKKKKASGGNGAGKRRIPAPSAHELHYAAKRAQAEEMRKRTYLPYRQGLLSCLGFSSRSYSLVNGLAKTLHHHPVPSR